MRILQFAYDGDAYNPYLPSNYVMSTVVYTGTHDNPTTREWYEDLPDDRRRNLWRSMKRSWGRQQRGRARAPAAAGRAQPGSRSPDERARLC
jgi:4-alpha-glucanotransferase